MDIDFAAWMGLALRWFHLMAGIMWIGTSFYFIWLGNALKPPTGEDDKKAGVAGEVWAVHGGGFYHKKKYAVAPDHMPDDLHWFKWEAYLTWLSGILLLTLIYYSDANLYLIDREKMILHRADAVLIGVAFIAGGWFVYDALCKSDIGKNNSLFGIIWFALLTATTYVLCQIFSGRGAFIHVGAIVGTVMAANVFAVIIPNQKIAVATLLKGKKPDPRLGKQAGQRSLHNNYMTLPVLLIMISNHYPMLFSHPYNWLILAGLSASSLSIREFFNRQDRGITNHWFVVAGVAGFILVALGASIHDKPVATSPTSVSAAQIFTLIQTHCSACHSATPKHAGIHTAPNGVMFDTLAEIKKYAPRIEQQTVKTKAMPLGNETHMTDEERATLGIWLSQLPR